MRYFFVLLTLLLFSACSEEDSGRSLPRFYGGQMVRMKAFGNEGMVVSVWCQKIKYGGGCFYSVRFPAMQVSTSSGFFGGKYPVEFAPVALVSNVREYELEAKP